MYLLMGNDFVLFKRKTTLCGNNISIVNYIEFSFSSYLYDDFIDVFYFIILNYFSSLLGIFV